MSLLAFLFLFFCLLLQRMAELQEAGGLAYSDVTFMNDATEALLEVRSVIDSGRETHVAFSQAYAD